MWAPLAGALRPSIILLKTSDQRTGQERNVAKRGPASPWLVCSHSPAVAGAGRSAPRAPRGWQHSCWARRCPRPSRPRLGWNSCPGRRDRGGESGGGSGLRRKARKSPRLSRSPPPPAHCSEVQSPSGNDACTCCHWRSGETFPRELCTLPPTRKGSDSWRKAWLHPSLPSPLRPTQLFPGEGTRRGEGTWNRAWLLKSTRRSLFPASPLRPLVFWKSTRGSSTEYSRISLCSSCRPESL